MKFNTQELRDFMLNCAAIKTNILIPVLSYIHLRDNIITKNNLHSFVSQEISTHSADQLLMDEKMLSTFITLTKDAMIDITQENAVIKYSDSEGFTTHPVCADQYLISEDTSEENAGIVFNEDVIKSITLAKNFCAEEGELRTFRSYIFVGLNHIYASDGFIGYFKRNATVPATSQIVISKEIVQAINKFKTITVTENESYYFYTADKMKFGFAKTETKFFNMLHLMQYENARGIAISKDDFTRSCDMCIAYAMNDIPVSSFIKKDNALTVKLEANQFNNNVQREIKIIQHDAADDERAFRFNPIHMNRLMKSLADETLIFYKGENRTFIYGKESNTITLILEII